MDKSLLNYALCWFILEVTNERNELYPQETLYSLVMALQMYFHSQGVYHKFLQDSAFVEVRNTLDNRMKSLSKQGLVMKKEKAQPFTLSHEEKMWSSGVLGESNPEQLLNTVIYLLGIHCSLRAVDEHKALKIGYYLQIKCKFDKELNAHFLKYRETYSKNHQGGLADLNIKPKVITVYENKGEPLRYVIYLYKKYVGLRPNHDPKCSYDLYLWPLKRYTEHMWYSC